MNLRWLTEGLFNGLDSLEVLKIKDASQMQSVKMGVLDGVHETLKEFVIESNSSYKWHHDYNEIKQVRQYKTFVDPIEYHYDHKKFKKMKVIESTTTTTSTTTASTTSTTSTDPLHWYIDKQKLNPVRAYQSVEAPNPLEIDSFTGSQQDLRLEYMKIRYYLYTLTSKSFVALKNIKHLDLSNCGIESILQGTFDSIVSTVKILRLMNNPFKHLPAAMFELVPLSSDTYIFMGDDVNECECENLPINYIIKVDCFVPTAAYKRNICHSFLPIKQADINLMTTTVALKSSTYNATVQNQPISKRTTINLITTSKPTIVSTATTVDSKDPSIQSEATISEINEPSMLTATEPEQTNQGQSYFQISSKYTYVIIVGVAVLLSLVFFIVWFKFFKQRRFAFVSQDDSI